MVDEHEFNITPQGTALVSAFHKQPYDLSKLGGKKKGWLLSGVAQEIDIATGKLLFEWDSLDHVGFDETYLPVQGGHGTNTLPYDYFHINTIEDAGDGDLLIGARNTWCMYKVSRKTGKIVWRLNGKKTDFTMGPGSEFYWQHDTRLHGPDTLTVFDDGYDGVLRQEREGVTRPHPQRRLRPDAGHAAQAVHAPRASSCSPRRWETRRCCRAAACSSDGAPTRTSPSSPPDGKLLLDGRLTQGRPDLPVVHRRLGGPSRRPARGRGQAPRAGGATVYASWNGATEVASWTVLAGGAQTSLARIGSAPK